MKWEDRFLHRTEKLKRRIEIIQKQQDLVFNIRLSIALGIFALLVVAVLFPAIGLELPVLVVGLLLFAYFVVRSNQLKLFRRKLELLTSFYKRQSARILNTKESLKELNSEEELIKAPLALSEEAEQLSRDLDFFGQNSLWSNISEAFSAEGEARLQQVLLNPELDLTRIQKTQARVLTASSISGFLRKFVILGFLGRKEFKDLPLLESEIQKTEYSEKTEKIFWFLMVVWMCAFAELVLFLSKPSFEVPVAFRLLFPLVSLISMRGLSEIYSRAQTVSTLFSRLRVVLEHMNKVSPTLKLELLPVLKLKDPLKLIAKFDRNLSFLTVNSHPLVVLILNFIFPWNYFFTRKLEQARRQLALDLPLVIKEMGEMEKLSSFAFLLHYRKTVFPQFSDSPQMECVDISHPMGDAQFIKNTVAFNHEKLVLLTGSNMSGKSTFMRTLGTNHALALAGAPVFASSFTTFLAPIRPCIRVSDSLRDGASYFYAEVKRLKLILEEAKSSKPIFFLVDEIFKGTNNIERFLGSRELILFLSQTSSFGLISTHDIELSKLENERIKNWHFSDSIENGQLRFSYKIKSGPSPSTNALTIMKMEGLPVPPGNS
jgi:hypothetical protein